MARYLDPTGTKFWEIERDGATIVRRSGKLGSKGRAQTHTYASALHARFEYGAIVGQKTHTEKYVAESPAPAKPVDDFPFDDEARLVHADLLQSRGDPLGELIVLQHRVAVTPDFQAAQKLQREIDELLDANADKWFGDLWQARELFDFEWRLGRLRRVRLAPDHQVEIARLLPDVPLCYQLGTFLEALFELEIARSLEELELGTAGSLDLQDTMRKLVERAPPTLRRLEIERSRGAQTTYEYGAHLYEMRFPALEEFHCELDLSDAAVRHVATADWPKLHTLSFGMRGYSDAPSFGVALQPPDELAPGIAQLAPLFENAGALRSLEIKTSTPTPVARAMIALGALSHLEEIVIRSKRVMDPETQAALTQFNPNARYIQMPAYSMRPGQRQ